MSLNLFKKSFVYSFDRENIARTMGLLQTNGVTSSSVAGEGRGHALYPIFSIVNNSCVSNTRSVDYFPKKILIFFEDFKFFCGFI